MSCGGLSGICRQLAAIRCPFGTCHHLVSLVVKTRTRRTWTLAIALAISSSNGELDSHAIVQNKQQDHGRSCAMTGKRLWCTNRRCIENGAAIHGGNSCRAGTNVVRGAGAVEVDRPRGVCGLRARRRTRAMSRPCAPTTALAPLCRDRTHGSSPGRCPEQRYRRSHERRDEEFVYPPRRRPPGSFKVMYASMASVRVMSGLRGHRRRLDATWPS